MGQTYEQYDKKAWAQVEDIEMNRRRADWALVVPNASLPSRLERLSSSFRGTRALFRPGTDLEKRLQSGAESYMQPVAPAKQSKCRALGPQSEAHIREAMRTETTPGPELIEVLRVALGVQPAGPKLKWTPRRASNGSFYTRRGFVSSFKTP